MTALEKILFEDLQTEQMQTSELLTALLFCLPLAEARITNLPGRPFDEKIVQDGFVQTKLAIMKVMEREYNPFEPDNQSELYKRIAAVMRAAKPLMPLEGDQP